MSKSTFDFGKFFLSVIFYPAARILYHPQVFFENENRKKLSLDVPTILICNHISHIDGTIVSYVFRKFPLRHLAAKDRFEQGGFIGWYLKKSKCIPIDRQSISTEWVHTSLQALTQEKVSLAIYPEGKHGKNHEILPFHSGVTMLAVLAQVPVMLVYNDGPYRVGKRCRFMISEPFRLDPPTQGMTAEYVQQQTDLLHQKMLDLQQLFRNRVGE